MSRARAKRIFGMTVRQWAVLGFLFLSVVCVLAGGLWWLNSIVAAAYAGLNAPIAAVTPRPTATLMPTATPTPTASPTPIAYESLIPEGWLQFTPDVVPGLEVWLPNSFVVPLESEKDASYQIVDPADTRVKSVMFLRDTTLSAYFVFTTFQFYTRPIFASDLDKMVDAQFADLMQNGALLERRVFVFQTEDYPAQRVTFEVSFKGSEAGLAVYVIQVGTDVFYLGFTTPFNELYARLPDFDRIVQTFRVVK